MHPKPPSARVRNATLRAEIDAWLEATEADATAYVNLRAAGFTSMRDAKAWASHHKIAAAPLGGRLLVRRADVAPFVGQSTAFPAPAARPPRHAAWSIDLVGLLFGKKAEAAEPSE